MINMFDIKGVYRRLVNSAKPKRRDRVGLSDSLEVRFIKNGKIIERRKIKGHTWLDDGLHYVMDCLHESDSKVPIDSMSAFGPEGDSWKSASTFAVASASPWTITWTAGWVSSGELTVSAFVISAAGTTYASISFSEFIKQNGVSMDVYYTSSIMPG